MASSREILPIAEGVVVLYDDTSMDGSNGPAFPIVVKPSDREGPTTEMLELEVVKLFLNLWNLGIPQRSVRFFPFFSVRFSPWLQIRFPSSFCNSHDVLTDWEANFG